MVFYNRFSTVVVVTVGLALPAPAAVLQWDFNDNLDASTSGDAALVADAADPASVPDVTFQIASIRGEGAQVAAFTRGTFFRLPYSLSANGGGRFVNEYTLVLDVMFPDRSPSGGWAALLQTNKQNDNDGDWFVDPSGGVGISGNYGGGVADGVWHRLAVVVDLSAGTFVSYVDGAEVQRLSGQEIDGRFALYLDEVLIFADESGENAAGLVNSVQFRDSALSAAAIDALGGPSAAGIPIDNDPPPVTGSLLNRWFFSPVHVSGRLVEDLVGDRPATIEGGFDIVTDPDAIFLDGTTGHLTIGGSSAPSSLPQVDLTAEAWVSLDAGTRWGGILGYIQDNGDFEKGWLLGYDNSSFTIALSTSGSLTYLTGNTVFEQGEWYHVVATYDGSTLRLFVNGQLDATSTSHSGNVDYASSTFVMGCYLDDNEFYPMEGRLHEVCLYDRALTPSEIRTNFEAKRDLFPGVAPLHLGPFLQFVGRDAATIRWETVEATASILSYGMTRELTDSVVDSVPKQAHSLTVTGLEPETLYFYAVTQEVGGSQVSTPIYEFSTEFNHSATDISDVLSPYPPDELSGVYGAAADHILQTTGVTKGYCLDFDCGDGRLAFELAKRSDLRIVGVSEETESVELARRRLQQAGVYGSKVTVHLRSLSDLPFTANCFNLIVSGHMMASGEARGSPTELYRVVRPSGGTAHLGQPPGVVDLLQRSTLESWLDGASFAYDVTEGQAGLWASVVRPALEGAGEWTHMYGDPGQTASSGDTLVRGEDMTIQWFGRPGPRGMVDRQARNPAPLTKSGRLFVQGDNRVFAMDAYNGAILWSLELPDSRRVNIPRDTGNWCTDGDNLYLAVKDTCWRLDGTDGELSQVYEVTEVGDPAGVSWGYLAVIKEQLLGSRVKPGSHYTEFKGPDKWYDTTSGGFGTAMVTSDRLFAVDKASGERTWTYDGGAILNSSIAVGGGHIYFVECRDPVVVNSENGRIGSSALWRDQHLVAVSVATGDTSWERPISFPSSPVPLAFYLCHSEDKLVVVVSTSRYHVLCFSAADGSPLWSREHAWNRSHHGGHMYHPVITAGTVFVEPRAYDLVTGSLVIPSLPARGGCSTLSGADNTLHFVDWDYHNGSFYFWDLDTGERAMRAGSRASCWLSIISGGGMILSPTSSTGCTCRYPLQTSIGYRSW